MEKINKSLNKISEIRFELSYDPDAIRWLIISLRIDNDYKLYKSTDKSWTMSKKISYNKLPYIGDISEKEKVGD